MLDYNPESSKEREIIIEAIKKTASSFNFDSYDIPNLEKWETYANKSSDEILEKQTYHFYDRSNRKVILRPEVTPSLARLASKDIKKRALPLRWYTIARCYRYENPQKGRLREFDQLNVDLLGRPHPLYDFETIRFSVQLLLNLGLKRTDFKIMYNHRGLTSKILEKHHFNAQEQKDFFSLIDRSQKISTKAFEESLAETLPSDDKISLALKYVNVQEGASGLQHLISKGNDETISSEAQEIIEDFANFEGYLKNGGLSDVCMFSPKISRGFDYYTGMVFEVFATSQGISRSIFGGGRYDNLIKNFSDDEVSGIGFGMGLHILGLLLKEKNLLDDSQPRKKCLVSPISQQHLSTAIRISNQLMKDESVELTTPASIKKQFQKADKKNMTHIVLVGDEETSNQNFTIKELSSGKQEIIELR